MATQGNLYLQRGDDMTLGVTVMTSSGTPYNLSGCVLVLTVHQNTQYFSPPVLTETTTGHISAVGGVSQIAFAAADTSGFNDVASYYDIKLYAPGPTGYVTTTTLQYGQVQFYPVA